MSAAASKAVFLSYASQDADAARRICDALRAAGVEVWFDQSELVGGDAWDAKIRQQIKECALFVPIISANTNARLEGYFRLEWLLAVERSRLMAEERAFLLPIVIDGTTDEAAKVPEKFRDVQWTRLAGGETGDAFCARVQALLDGGLGARPPSAVLAEKRPEAAALPEKTPWATRRWFAAISGAALLALALWRPWQPPPPVAAPATLSTGKKAAPPPAALPTDKSIAVLPFANLSPDKENEFFADGVHADLLANLLGLRALRVISAQSVSGYRGTTKKISDIARELGVAYVLTGSVRRAGDTVRVSAQLIDARTDAPLWSPQPYTRKLTDIFALQSELAQSIAGELEAALTPEEKQRLASKPTENLAAYDLFLKANEGAFFRYEDQEGSQARLVRREALLQAAVALDPRFATAWAELARNHFSFFATKYDTTAGRLAQGEAALDRAKQLAPEAPATIRATFAHQYWTGDRDRASKEIERLLRVMPNDAEALSMQARFLWSNDRNAESLATMRQAARLDPKNAPVASDLSAMLWRVRRFTEAAESMRHEMTLSPANDRLTIALARLAFQASGSTREMEQLATQLEQDNATASDAPRFRILGAIWRGDLPAAIRFDEAQRKDPEAKPGNAPGFVNGDGAGDMALIYLFRGDAKAARARLGKFPALLRADLVREPDNTRLLRYLATVEAILGNKPEALRLAERSVEISSKVLSYGVRANAREVLAQVCTIVGEKDRAFRELSDLLNSASQVNIHELRVMPAYFNLRGDPRLDALVNDPKNNQPVF